MISLRSVITPNLVFIVHSYVFNKKKSIVFPQVVAFLRNFIRRAVLLFVCRNERRRISTGITKRRCNIFEESLKPTVGGTRISRNLDGGLNQNRAFARVIERVVAATQ